MHKVLAMINLHTHSEMPSFAHSEDKTGTSKLTRDSAITKRPGLCSVSWNVEHNVISVMDFQFQLWILQL